MNYKWIEHRTSINYSSYCLYTVGLDELPVSFNMATYVMEGWVGHEDFWLIHCSYVHEVQQRNEKKISTCGCMDYIKGTSSRKAVRGHATIV